MYAVIAVFSSLSVRGRSRDTAAKWRSTATFRTASIIQVKFKLDIIKLHLFAYYK